MTLCSSPPWQDWPPWLNFINVLCTAFTLVDPKSVKRHWWLKCIFYTFGIYECNVDEIDTFFPSVASICERSLYLYGCTRNKMCQSWSTLSNGNNFSKFKGWCLYRYTVSPYTSSLGWFFYQKSIMFRGIRTFKCSLVED